MFTITSYNQHYINTETQCRKSVDRWWTLTWLQCRSSSWYKKCCKPLSTVKSFVDLKIILSYAQFECSISFWFDVKRIGIAACLQHLCLIGVSVLGHTNMARMGFPMDVGSWGKLIALRQLRLQRTQRDLAKAVFGKSMGSQNGHLGISVTLPYWYTHRQTQKYTRTHTTIQCLNWKQNKADI